MLGSQTKRAELSIPRAGAPDSHHTPTPTRLLSHAYTYTPTLTPLGAQLSAARLLREETTESHDRCSPHATPLLLTLILTRHLYY
jgi:hypothetical protein